MYRGIANKLAVYAYNQTTGLAVTGDQANITAQISKDGAASAATNDVNPTQLDATNHKGVYIFDLTATESDAQMAVVSPASTTANVVLEPVEIQFDPAPFPVFAVVADAGNTSATFKTDRTEATNDFWKAPTHVCFFTGNLAGQIRKLAASSPYNGTTKFLTVADAFTAAPATGDKAYLINS